MYLFLGAADLLSSRHKQDRAVNLIKISDRYDVDTLENDLALLHLANPVIPDRYVGFICLPDSGE